MLKAEFARARKHLAVVLATSAFFLGYVAAGQEAPPEKPQLIGHADRLAPFVPTPHSVVKKMLELAQVDRHDRIYDLGSGDGRIVIMAAQKFHAEAVGVELDEELFKQSSAQITALGLEKRANILHANMYEVELRPATVVTLYLLTSVNERLRPLLEKQLRPGARVVSHDFQIPGWKPDKTETVTSETGIPHTLYLYVRPSSAAADGSTSTSP